MKALITETNQVIDVNISQENIDIILNQLFDNTINSDHKWISINDRQKTNIGLCSFENDQFLDIRLLCAHWNHEKINPIIIKLNDALVKIYVPQCLTE